MGIRWKLTTKAGAIKVDAPITEAEVADLTREICHLGLMPKKRRYTKRTA